MTNDYAGDARLRDLQRRNALGTMFGTITDEERQELATLYRERDRRLAQALLDACDVLYVEDDELPMLEAEGAICERLDIPLGQTEQGLAPEAVAKIEAFVTRSLGRPWTYQDSGLLGA